MVLPVAVPKVSSHNIATSASSSARDASGYYGSPNGSYSRSGSVSGSMMRDQNRTSALSSSSSQRGFVTESFVKIEGFDFDSKKRPESPKAEDEARPSLLTQSLGGAVGAGASGIATLERARSPPSSSSLLRRQASRNSSDRELNGLGGLGSLTPASPPPKVPPSDGSTDGNGHIETLLGDLQRRYSVFNESLVVRAFNMSRLAHDGNVNSGAVPGPTFEKCVSSAVILANLGADETAVSAALLHDCLDGRMLTEAQMRPMLGSEQAVEHVKSGSHMSFLLHRFEQLSPVAMRVCAPQETSPQCLDFISLLLSHASPKALLVRLSVALAELKLCADAVRHDSSMVHNTYVQKVAHQAMNVWAPLANRIGVWSIKSQLEDLSFSCLLPTEHMVLARALRPAQEPTTLVKLMDGLRSALQESDIDHLDLTGRPKHLWGVWCKMQKKGYSAEEVQDVRGLRVIVSSREECYRVLRAVETSWKVVGRTKNYIKEPKKNGYQSLHVIADPGDGHLVEIQIRTDKMHYLAEYGAHASHWKYKEVDPKKATKASSMNAATNEGSATNWAKFETQKHVGIDQKFRPSGSPTEDKSLERIMAAWKEQAAKAREENEVNEREVNTKSFHQYIEESGQVLAPPDVEDANARVGVALVRGGTFAVETVAQGTTVAELLSDAESSQEARIIVNRVEVHPGNFGARLKNGDAVEVHYVTTTPVSAASAPSPASQGNLMPIRGNLSGLTSKLRQVSL